MIDSRFFIRKSIIIHGKFYDYSKVNLTRMSDVVTIVDPDFGEWDTKAGDHVYHKKIHPLRVILNRQRRFIDKASAVHGDFYDYSKVLYINSDTKVIIIDPVYGEFSQLPHSHLSGQGHPAGRGRKTAAALRDSKEEFVVKARATHGALYNYDMVVYESSHKKVIIVDPDHGAFDMAPYSHIQGQGHPTRGRISCNKKRMLGYDEFVRRSKEQHGPLYDYSKAIYKGVDTKVIIIHPTLGEFKQTPYEHMNGSGHPKAQRRALFDRDHIIPIAIVLGRRNADSFEKNRPLVKFLNSDLNIQSLKISENCSKNDLVSYRGNKVRASAVRNLYHIIHEIVLDTLHIDISVIIDEDKKYISDHFAKSLNHAVNV